MGDRGSPAAAAKSLQLCPTLCDPIDGSPPGSTVPGILQARTLEWVAISFSNAWKWKVKVKLLSRVWLFTTPWTAAYQAPPSMGFSRQEYWSGLPLPSTLDRDVTTTKKTTTNFSCVKSLMLGDCLLLQSLLLILTNGTRRIWDFNPNSGSTGNSMTCSWGSVSLTWGCDHRNNM